jgi:hypothetical protein
MLKIFLVSYFEYHQIRLNKIKCYIYMLMFFIEKHNQLQLLPILQQGTIDRLQLLWPEVLWQNQLLTACTLDVKVRYGQFSLFQTVSCCRISWLCGQWIPPGMKLEWDLQHWNWRERNWNWRVQFQFREAQLATCCTLSLCGWPGFFPSKKSPENHRKWRIRTY